MHDSWINKQKIVLGFPKCDYLFGAIKITGDIKNYVPISILLNKTKIVEIKIKFFISLVILKAQKKQTTFHGTPCTICFAYQNILRTPCTTCSAYQKKLIFLSLGTFKCICMHGPICCKYQGFQYWVCHLQFKVIVFNDLLQTSEFNSS